MTNSPTAAVAADAPEHRGHSLRRATTVGILAGFLSGLFGVGGGILIVPGLVFLLGMDQHRAHGTSLAAIFPIATAGVLGFALEGSVDWSASVFLIAGSLGGAVIGTSMLRRIATGPLRLIFAATLLLAAGRMLIELGAGGTRADLDLGLAAGLFGLGLTAGILAGLLGVGGGIVMVPGLTLLFSVADAVAKGTSLAVIVPTALIGTRRNVRVGYADLPVAATIGLAGVVSAFLASKVAVRLSPTLSSVLFAILLVVVASRLVYRQFSTSSAPHGKATSSSRTRLVGSRSGTPQAGTPPAEISPSLSRGWTLPKRLGIHGWSRIQSTKRAGLGEPMLETRLTQLRNHRVPALAIPTIVILLAGLVAAPTIDDGGSPAGQVEARESDSDAAADAVSDPTTPREDDETSSSQTPGNADSGNQNEVPGSGGGSTTAPTDEHDGGGSGGEGAPGPDYSSVPGVTADEIRIGFWLVNSDAGCAALGLTGEGTSCTNEDQGQINALADYVNSHGGVAGRDLVPVFHESDATNGTYAAQAQAACTAFTEDKDVFAVVSEGVVGRPFMATCLAQNGTPVIDPGFWPFDASLYDELDPYLYQPSRPRPERWVAAYVDGLADQGFFEPGTTLGLLRFDSAPFDRVTENVLKPRLAAHGQQLAEDIEIQTPDSVSAYGSMNNELSNAILRMRTRGVDHVIFFATHGEMAVFYFQQAEAQGYRPAYGMSSMESMRLQSEQGPPGQFDDAVGVGWMPQFDVFAGDDPGGSSTADLCKQIIQGAGLDGGAGRHTHCDNVFFLDAALDRIDTFDAQGFETAVEGLGTSWNPAATFAAKFGPDRHDGPAGLRYTKWNGDCDCFRYQGGTRPLP